MRIKQMKTLKLVAAIAALTGSMGASAANIDLFTDPVGTTKVSLAASVNSTNTTITDSASTTTITPSSISGGIADLTPSSDFNLSSDGGTGSILGGYRGMEVELISLDGNISTTGNAELLVSQNLSGVGRLTFNSSDGIVARGTVQWDGNNNSTTLNTSAFNEDITDGGNADRFIFDVISADQGFNFSIGIYDADGSSVIFDLPATTTTLGTGSYSSTLLFSDFNNAFGTFTSNCTTAGINPGVINSATCVNGTTAGIDFTNISAMELILNTSVIAGATASLDMTIGGITTVPEPSSLALIGLGLMATGFASKRKSKKA